MPPRFVARGFTFPLTFAGGGPEPPIATQPNEVGFYWFKHEELSFEIPTEIVQTLEGGFIVRYMQRDIPLEKMPRGRWRGPIRERESRRRHSDQAQQFCASKR